MQPSPATSRTLYEDLDHVRQQVRLLCIGPCQDDNEPIECTMRTVSLEDKPVYEAISYVWGDPRVTRTVTINGFPLHITANLAVALRRFRTRDCSRREAVWLWADAICINQGDTPERSSQVAIMHLIYSRARTVRIWLGSCERPDGNEEGIAAHAMKFLASWEDASFNVLRNAVIDGATYKQHLTDPPRNSLEYLLNAPYFYRAWVLQEAALAKSMIWFCGPYEARINTVILDALFILQMETSLGPSFAAFEFTDVIQTTPAAEAPSPMELVEASQSTRCADPRDHVYALRGILTQLAAVMVDYTKPVRDVYVDATLEFIHSTQGLENLLADRRSPSFDLPSWAIHFGVNEGSHETLNFKTPTSSFTDPSHRAQFSFNTLQRDRIQVRGCKIDEIDRVYNGRTKSSARSEHAQEVLEIIKHWRDAYMRNVGIENTTAPESKQMCAFWETLQWNSARHNAASDPYAYLERSLNNGSLEQATRAGMLDLWSRSCFIITRKRRIGISRARPWCVLVMTSMRLPAALSRYACDQMKLLKTRLWWSLQRLSTVREF